MSHTPFHPLVEEWFSNRFGHPTEPQKRAWPEIQAGRHTLIAAPTGSGKTLAAFLVCIDDLVRQGLDGTLADEIQTVYVSPLKALSNDIRRNLEGPLEEITALAAQKGLRLPRIRTLVRTGDTPAHERAAMLKTPPHILVTTPESLYLVLTSEKSRKLLRTVRTVIVDEIHALARDKRGSHLTLSLERLDGVARQAPEPRKMDPQPSLFDPIRHPGMGRHPGAGRHPGEGRDPGLKPSSMQGRELDPVPKLPVRPVDDVHGSDRDGVRRGDALVRIGLSATQKPIDEIAHFLVGNRPGAEAAIVDVGHVRALDLAVEVPGSELAAVCSNEQWDEIYKRLGELVNAHRSTVVFVNTRRMAERVSHRLREELGENSVASHHGSLSRQIRLSAEERLKKGELKAIVATASLELGIDIGFIDLVCQLGSPRSIATFLQRVGRSGHHLGVVPKGRLFALTRDELLESLAILRAVRQGRLDRVEIPVAPLDILEQQIVAEVAAQDWDEDDLFDAMRRAWPYKDLKRTEFNRIVTIASEGIATGRREGAYLHRDRINNRLKPRRAARLTAVTSGGAIPETADYKVVTEDDGSVVGTVNEDFAIESLAGDVFLLGNTSWRIRYVRAGQVVVRDAEGAPASVPFWLGEAPGRTVELSEELSFLRKGISDQLGPVAEGGSVPTPEGLKKARAFIKAECGVDDWAADQASAYVAAQKAAVGMVPTQTEVLFERFFDESGGMQLVIHAPFGSRINRAWGLAMRKRFCRTFDFELQASADDNGITLSLGPQHSFPLQDMFKLLSSRQAEEVLVQALLAAPMFGVRWRWNVTRALAVLRMKGGKKNPPPLQRFKADDLLSAVFPLQTACFEHRPPDVPIPDHPLVAQTVFDCLHEAMDVDGWRDVLTRIEAGSITLVARDTREPSPFSHAILNANPYAFLDDAPLEERRARAVSTRRLLSPADMTNLARLDPDAIERVRAEATPVIRDPEELHDTLLTLNAVPEVRGETWAGLFEELVRQKRAAIFVAGDTVLWVAAERLSLVKAAFPEGQATPALDLPPELAAPVDSDVAVAELVRGRLAVAGPITAQKIADILGLPVTRVETALAKLELEGFVLQGHYTENTAAIEWCERRLLARIHRLTLEGARKRVQPVSLENYWLFLADFHHLIPGTRRDGQLGLREALGQLEGFEMPAGAWEMDILAGRIETYQPEWLDALSYSGELTWGRLRMPSRAEADEDEEQSEASPRRKPSRSDPCTSSTGRTGSFSTGSSPQTLFEGNDSLDPGLRRDDGGRYGGLTRVVPVTLGFRDDLAWLLPPERAASPVVGGAPIKLRGEAETVYVALQRHGALFLRDIEQMSTLPLTRVEDALSELAALGLVTADGFSALRNLVNARRWEKIRGRRGRPRTGGYPPAASYRGASTGAGGRWTLFPGPVRPAAREERIEQWARQLIRRYGVVFRDLLTRETVAPAWWELVTVYRRLEARGEIRGGRFIAGVAAEQYALPESVESLRIPRAEQDTWVIISAADPLNLSGFVLDGPRVPATRGNRILLHNGKIAATLQSGEIQIREAVSADVKEKITRALRLTQLPDLRDEILKDLAARVPSKP